jgi:hypothetical protein
MSKTTMKSLAALRIITATFFVLTASEAGAGDAESIRAKCYAVALQAKACVKACWPHCNIPKCNAPVWACMKEYAAQYYKEHGQAPQKVAAPNSQSTKQNQKTDKKETKSTGNGGTAQKQPPPANNASNSAQHQQSDGTTQTRSPQQTSPVPNQRSASPQQTSPLPNQQSVSCNSTITSKTMEPSAATNCRTGNSLLAAARAVRTQNTTAAAETLKEAADAYRRAGDITGANKILEEALSLVVASMPNPPPQVEDPVEELANKRPLPDLPPAPSQPEAPSPGKQSSAQDSVKKTDVDPNDSSFPTSVPELCGGGFDKFYERQTGPNGSFDDTCIVAKNNCPYAVRFRWRSSKTRCPPNVTAEELRDPNKKINCINEAPVDASKGGSPGKSPPICTTDEGEAIYNYGFRRPQ